MFIIMKNLVLENSYRSFVPNIDREIIEFFCNLYNIELNENIHKTLDSVRKFINL